MKKIIKNLFIIAFVGFLTLTLSCTVLLSAEDFKSDARTIRKSEEYKSSNKLERINLLAKSIESTLNKKIFLKDNYIDIYGLFQKVLQKKVVHEGDTSLTVIKDKNGLLTASYPVGNITNYTKKLNSLADFSKENDIYFLYIKVPWRNTDDSLPFYIKDNCQDTSDRLVASFNDNVNVLDLEELLPKEKEKLFFKTDHHWNTETAFASYQHIIKDLDSKLDLNLTDKYLNDYDFKTYKNIFLGTYGKRTGKYYGGWDDFTYITPKFETNLQVINYRNVGKVEDVRKGSFADTLTYPEFLDKNLDRDLSVYYTYGKGTKAEVNITNLMPYNNKKLLILKDSYADIVYPFLSLNFKQTKVVDVRRYRAIHLFRYINKYQPDAIIFLQSPLDLYTEDLINFQEK